MRVWNGKYMQYVVILAVYCISTGPDTSTMYRIAKKFHLENFFAFFTPLSWVKVYRAFSPHVNDYIEPMAIFTTWANFLR